MRTLILCLLVVATPAYAQRPVADADGDGVSDDADHCPNDPEDKDGFDDADGCPEPDNDRDGVPDIQDLCPNQPETRNGFNDEDGCPDKVVESLKLPSTTPPAKSVNYACHPGQPNFGSNSCKCPAGSTPAMNGNTAICKQTARATRIEPRHPETPATGTRPAAVTPTGYRCGPGGKLVVGKGCTCAADRIERRDADGVSVCARRVR